MIDERKEHELQRERDRKLYNTVTKNIEQACRRLEMGIACNNKQLIANQEEQIAKQKRFFKDATGIDYDEF